MFKNVPACRWGPNTGYEPSDTFQTPFNTNMYPMYGGGPQHGFFAGYGNAFVAPGPMPYGGYGGGVGCGTTMAPFGMAQGPFGMPMPATQPSVFPSLPQARCAKPPEEYPAFPGTRGPNDRRRGVQYLYPKSHTFIHVVNFEKYPKPWERPGTRFKYEIFQVDSGISVPGLIKRLGGDDKAVVTEFVELGDGCWEKGQTVEQTGVRALEALEFFGWGTKRGTEQNPVWLQVHAP